MTNPPSGTASVVVTIPSAHPLYAGATTFSGVNQAGPVGAYTSLGIANGSTGVNSAGLTNIPSAVGELVYDMIAVDGEGNVLTLTPGAGQTNLWTANTTSFLAAGASVKPGTASVTNTWAWSPVEGEQFAIGAVSVKPAPASGTNVAVFTQAPAFAQPFTLPAGGAVSITNFVTLSSGSMPTNPAVTATLRYNGTLLLTLTNAAYNPANSNLVWTGTVGATTIPAGQAITYTLTNNQAGVTYTLNYGSQSKPAKISLPTTTVIHVNSLAVYDAPYPGGNLVSTPAAGSILYVRADVSDPFGNYDIASVNLAIDGPGTNSDVSLTLTNSSIVA